MMTAKRFERNRYIFISTTNKNIQMPSNCVECVPPQLDDYDQNNREKNNNAPLNIIMLFIYFFCIFLRVNTIMIFVRTDIWNVIKVVCGWSYEYAVMSHIATYFFLFIIKEDTSRLCLFIMMLMLMPIRPISRFVKWIEKKNEYCLRWEARLMVDDEDDSDWPIFLVFFLLRRIPNGRCLRGIAMVWLRFLGIRFIRYHVYN